MALVDIDPALATNLECDKLQGYWGFTGCQYHKGFQTCSEPNQFTDCLGSWHANHAK